MLPVPCPRPHAPSFKLRLPDGTVGRASQVTPHGMHLQSRVRWTIGQLVALELGPPGWRMRIAADGVVALVTTTRGTTTATIRFTRLRVLVGDSAASRS